MANKVINYCLLAILVGLSFISVEVFAHGVDDNTRAFLEHYTGVQFSLLCISALST